MKTTLKAAMVILSPSKLDLGHSSQLWEFRATKLFLEKRTGKMLNLQVLATAPHQSISGWAWNLTWTYCPYIFANFNRSKQVRNLASIINHCRLYEAQVSKRNNVTEIQKKMSRDRAHDFISSRNSIEA